MNEFLSFILYVGQFCSQNSISDKRDLKVRRRSRNNPVIFNFTGAKIVLFVSNKVVNVKGKNIFTPERWWLSSVLVPRRFPEEMIALRTTTT